ncbi:hypothetical protein SDC9_130836 [bioreactor metagenome]|uniref:Uncharacterized protein n=1 Tax=bioreactor metagenome TaxID=1076179 RepID=A0A645D3N2_9ZZZZ
MVLSTLTLFGQNSEVTMSLNPTGVIRNNYDTLYNLEIEIQKTNISDADSVLFFLKGEVNNYLPDGINILTVTHATTTSQASIDVVNNTLSFSVVIGSVSSDIYAMKLIIFTEGQQEIIEKNIYDFYIN